MRSGRSGVSGHASLEEPARAPPAGIMQNAVSFLGEGGGLWKVCYLVVSTKLTLVYHLNLRPVLFPLSSVLLPGDSPDEYSHLEII